LSKGLFFKILRQFLFSFEGINRVELESDVLLLQDGYDTLGARSLRVSVELQDHCEDERWWKIYVWKGP